MPRESLNIAASPGDSPPGSSWRQIVGKHGTPEFAAAFTPDVFLRSSVLGKPVVGPQLLAAFLGASSAIYERLEFTYELADANKVFLEWEGWAFGDLLSGSTTLTVNDAGLVESIRLLQSPSRGVRALASELATRLASSMSSEYFA